MSAIYKNEIKRAFKSTGMGISLLVGCGLAIWHVISVIIPTHKFLISSSEFFTGDPLYIQEGLFYNWMGIVLFPVQSYIFFMIIPLLAVMPFGSSFFEDRSSGYLVNVCTRIKKEEYFKAKYLAVFLSGGVVVVIPLILNLALSALFLPMLIPDNGCNTTITCKSMGYELFYRQPILYILMFILINLIFAGLFATISLSCSYYFDHKFGVVIGPFVLYFFIYSLTNLLDKTEYSLFYILNGGTSNSSFASYLFYFVLLFILSYLVFMVKGKKEDVY
mgnify:CR=1 FL=1